MALCDSQTHFLHHNAAWKARHKIAGSIIGRRCEEVFPAMPPDWHLAFEQAKEGSTAEYAETFSHKAMGQASCFVWHFLPWQHPQGKIKGVLILVSVAENKWHLVMSQSPLGTALLSMDLAWLEANPALRRLLGYGEETWRTLSFLNVLHPAETDRMERNLALIRLGEMDLIRSEMQILHAERYYIRVEITISLVRNERQEPQCWILHVADVSHFHQQSKEVASQNLTLEREVLSRNKALEEAIQSLQVSNEQFDHFAHSVAHDLRAPLRHIQGYAEVLKDDFSDSLPTKAKEYIHHISQAGRRLGLMMDQLLQLARDSHKPLRKVWIELDVFMEDLMPHLRAMHPESNRVEWRMAIDAHIFADPYFLRVILLQLLSNAVKFSAKKERPVVIVKANYDERGTQVQIEDNGIGFDMQFYPKLFLIFERLSDREDFPGTGIGLASVKKAVLRQQGEIWASSRSGSGATFFFSIPRK